jgi:hypothetical protein
VLHEIGRPTRTFTAALKAGVEGRLVMRPAPVDLAGAAEIFELNICRLVQLWRSYQIADDRNHGRLDALGRQDGAPLLAYFVHGGGAAGGPENISGRQISAGLVASRPVGAVDARQFRR